MSHFDAQPEDSTDSFDADEPTISARQIELEFLVALGWTLTLGESRTGTLHVRSSDVPVTKADFATLHICLSDRFDGLNDLETD